jgi:YidC/Oxa1 family membrane protein insertase
VEDQGKRLLTAVIIAIAAMMVWNYFFPTQPPKPTEKPPAAGTAPAPAAGTAPAPVAGTAPAPAAGAAPVAAKPRGPEQILAFAFKNETVKFSNYGGVITSWVLTGGQFRDIKTKQPYELLPVRSRGIGGALQLSFVEAPNQVPVDAEWQVAEKRANGVTFVWQDSQLKIEKIFDVVPTENRVDLKVRISNLSQQIAKQSLALSVFGFQNKNETGGGAFAQPPLVWSAACFNGELTTRGINELLDDGPTSDVGARWAGMVHNYFLIGMAPNRSEEPDAGRIGCVMKALPEPLGAMRTDLNYPLSALNPGDVYERSMTTYFGPKFLNTLEKLSAELPSKPGFDAAVDLGFFAIIARPLLWLLQWFYGFAGNWGIAIILLTITVKLATLYWTQKSMRSMQEMAKLRPQLEKIKEKFPDDKQRQQVETMNLFKAHNVNPVAGCLPMLLQMPVWFALYKALNVAAELYHAPFIPGWIDDLTAADPYYVLPVALTIMMFLQSKITPQTATGAQQKMLTYGMPLMFGVFSFFFPAGLTLYIFTNTVLSAIHSLYMHHKNPVATAPAPQAADPSPPTKPVGKSKKKNRKNRK